MDLALGGGIPVGSLLTLQGAPHAGKTSFAIQLAMRAAMGAAGDIYVYVPDEGARGACTRMAQGYGLSRDNVAALDEDTMVKFGMELQIGGRVRVLDPDDDLVTLERVLESARRRQYGEERPTIFVLDSTQTLRLEEDEFDSERLRIGQVMNLLKKATRSWDCIVINISHVNRSAYRNKRQEDNINPLAGGAESATIERQSDIIVHLDGDVQAVVTARCIKNRTARGDKPTWQMRFDVGLARFTEIDYVESEKAQEAQEEQKRSRRLSEVQEAVEALLKQKKAISVQTGLSTNFIQTSISGRREEIKLALIGLVAQGAVESGEGPRRSAIWWLKAPETTPESSTCLDLSPLVSALVSEQVPTSTCHLSPPPIGGDKLTRQVVPAKDRSLETSQLETSQTPENLAPEPAPEEGVG